MEPTPEEIVKTYALSRYPFDRRPLEPLRKGEDRDLVCHVDGWQRTPEVEQFMATCIEKQDCATVVISGGSGTGRSSYANYVVDRWCELRDSSPTDALIVPWRVNTYDAEEQLWLWTLSIMRQIRKERKRRTVQQGNGMQLSDTTENAMRELQKGQPAALADSLNEVLAGVIVDLGSTRLICILEGINSQTYLTLTQDVFEFLDMVLVMTVIQTKDANEEVVGNMADLRTAQKAFLVKLRELTGGEIRDVINHRWAACSSITESPFDEAALEKAFADPPRPVARALRLVELLVKDKQIDHGNGPPWPGRPDLAFTEAETRQRVDLFDKELLGANF